MCLQMEFGMPNTLLPEAPVTLDNMPSARLTNGRLIMSIVS